MNNTLINIFLSLEDSYNIFLRFALSIISTKIIFVLELFRTKEPAKQAGKQNKIIRSQKELFSNTID